MTDVRGILSDGSVEFTFTNTSINAEVDLRVQVEFLDHDVMNVSLVCERD